MCVCGGDRKTERQRVCGGGVNRLSSYLCSNSVERESQEAHKGEKGAWKQSQVQDNDKVKCALNASIQPERDKALPADKVCVQQRGMGGQFELRGQISLHTHAHTHTSLTLIHGNTGSPASPAGEKLKQAHTLTFCESGCRLSLHDGRAVKV